MTQLEEPSFRIPFLPKGKATNSETDKRSSLQLPRLPNWWPYACAGLGITVLVALAFRPAPIAVDVEKVTQGAFKITIDAEGKTRVQERHVVTAPVAGHLQRMNLKVGDTVESGTVVGQIDTLSFDTQVRAIQARLKQLQAELVGVESQRPKSQELTQAEARLRVAESNQQAATAQVTLVRAALDQASRDRTRLQNLEVQGAISRQDREAAELEEARLIQQLEVAQQELMATMARVDDVREAIPLIQAQQRDPDYLINSYQAQIAGVEAELANLTDEARRTTITTPINGSVLRLPEASARFVSAGETLIELGDPTKLELVIDVLSTDATKISPGDTILVEKWGVPIILDAVVSHIEPAAFTEVSALGVEEQRVNVIGTFSTSIIKSSSSEILTNILGDGYHIEARIVTWADDNILQAPVSALYRCDNGWCVFVIESNRAQPRQVEVMQRNMTAAAISSGLQPGEQVILHPNEQIEAGRRVKVRNRK
ncbi:MAG: HlyD family efflux transporter periplasmic adaptor subunit [Cyanobacteria bacterium P01_F01_bin.116]